MSTSTHSQPQQQQPPSGPPTNEQLTQLLMITRGLNREAAAQEVAVDADQMKQMWDQVKALVCSGQSPQPSGQSGQLGSGSSGSPSGQAQPHEQGKKEAKW